MDTNKWDQRLDSPRMRELQMYEAILSGTEMARLTEYLRGRINILLPRHTGPSNPRSVSRTNSLVAVHLAFLLGDLEAMMEAGAPLDWQGLQDVHRNIFTYHPELDKPYARYRAHHQQRLRGAVARNILGSKEYFETVALPLQAVIQTPEWNNYQQCWPEIPLFNNISPAQNEAIDRVPGLRPVMDSLLKLKKKEIDAQNGAGQQLGKVIQKRINYEFGNALAYMLGEPPIAKGKR